ncbi:MAG: HAD-IA family hydrolase [Eubacteriales bacterium]|nr:HAD-IA family hydrolase [Eubacteriales bacterium]
MKIDPKQWDAIIFDVDGTLIDSIPFIIECFQQTFTQNLGQPADEAAIKATIGMPLESVFSSYPAEISENLMKTYLEYNLAHLGQGIGLFVGIPQMLQTLRKMNIPTAIVTSKRNVALQPSLRDFELAEYFDLIITKEDTVRHKPNPDPLFAAMDRLGLSQPGRVIYVGDSIHDLECAVRAGCQPVMVGWTRMPKSPLQQAHPAVWIDHPNDLITFLES